MISYEVLLKQLEKHVKQAQNSSNIQSMREQITAIQSLCDVLLQERGASMEIKQVVPVVSVSAPPTLQTTKLQETDANGDSIFDF